MDPDQSQNLITSFLAQCLPFRVIWFKFVNNCLRYAISNNEITRNMNQVSLWKDYGNKVTERMDGCSFQLD